MGVEVRRIETEYGETGVGVSNRTDVTYELGAEIDGAWVKFGSVPGSTVEALVQRAREAQASQPQQATQASQPQTMEQVQQTPAPQQQAADTEQQQQQTQTGGTETQAV